MLLDLIYWSVSGYILTYTLLICRLYKGASFSSIAFCLNLIAASILGPIWFLIVLLDEDWVCVR
jgi:hypothetical protein